MNKIEEDSWFVVMQAFILHKQESILFINCCL